VNIEDLIEKMKPTLRALPVVRNWSDDELASRHQQFQLFRLNRESAAKGAWPNRRLRVVSTACWDFPIYSQTFVYQELAELLKQDFDLRFLYGNLLSREHLPQQFSPLWGTKRKLVFHHSLYEQDYAHFEQSMPERVASLVEKLCQASGLSEAELREQYHFRQAFSFARMVEAFRPDYLHSYFFYEGSFFTLVASYLLDIPRGVSCYADHVLQDYALKVVPFHLEQCSVVIATSHRIKRELMAIAPHVDADRIIVKPNAIDSERFPVVQRKDPAPGQPFRLVCVSRLEPKKGTVYLIEAARLLRDRGHNVHVHFLGGVDNNESSQKYAQSVDQRIRELDAAEFIHLEGRKNSAEIRQFLENAHMFVAPFVETESGDKDGIPTALLEAMASGIPTVATDAGSITEVIDDGQDGVIVPQRDPEALASAIQALILDPQRRQTLGAAAAGKARQQFDVRVCERRFHERIQQVVRK
jgi:glycosyltransferase involved in cell wall biosynthesis